MKKVLFVCHGNICRSPMAEFVFKRLVRRAGMEELFEVASAATSDDEIGNPVYPLAKRALAEHGIGCPGKTARQMVPDDYRHYDLLIGMDDANRHNMVAFFDGDPEGKVSLLLDHLPADDERRGRSVADPWFTRRFDVAYDDIQAGCTALFETLAADERQDG